MMMMIIVLIYEHSRNTSKKYQNVFEYNINIQRSTRKNDVDEKKELQTDEGKIFKYKFSGFFNKTKKYCS